MNLIPRIIRRLFANRSQPMATPTAPDPAPDPDRIKRLVERAAWGNNLTPEQHSLLLASAHNLWSTGLPWKQLVVTVFGAAARMANARDLRQGNENVVKIPRHEMQRIKGKQPTPPEAA